MNKNDISLALAVMGVVIPLGLTITLLAPAFALGVLVGPWLGDNLRD